MVITESDQIVWAVHCCNRGFSGPLGSLSSFRIALNIEFW